MIHRLVQLSTNEPIPFDCGDDDTPVVMYSLSNDRIDVSEMGASKNKILRPVPNAKRKYKSYPAVKIGTLR